MEAKQKHCYGRGFGFSLEVDVFLNIWFCSYSTPSNLIIFICVFPHFLRDWLDTITYIFTQKWNLGGVMKVFKCCRTNAMLFGMAFGCLAGLWSVGSVPYQRMLPLYHLSVSIFLFWLYMSCILYYFSKTSQHLFDFLKVTKLCICQEGDQEVTVLHTKWIKPAKPCLLIWAWAVQLLGFRSGFYLSMTENFVWLL